jgi:hypothetical protein
MPTYKVDIMETVIHTVVVTADDQDTALNNAYYVVEERLIDLYQSEWQGPYDSEITEVPVEENDNA